VLNNPLGYIDSSGMVPEWVQKDGEVFYDSRVVDQVSATELYGEDAVYRPNGDQYTSSGGTNVELGDHGFFKEDGEIKTNGDRAEDALNNQSVDHSGNILMGGAVLTAGQDNLLSQAVVLTGTAILALGAKAAHEISNIEQRPAGPQGVQYSLRATTPGDYTCFNCSTGSMTLNTGDVWKYGETIHPTTRY